jgi:hypothetical protein
MLCASGMKHVQHEWDFPPTRRRRHRRYPPTVYLDPPLEFRRTGSRFDIYQPSGWSSPITKKIINVYWAVMVTVVKMMVAVPLTAMVIGSVWLIWVLLRLGS